MIARAADGIQDLTPPNLITGLVTDLGVLNPMSGVSEELIRLYGA